MASTGMFPSPAEFSGQTFAIYPRVSTLVQGGEDMASLDAQVEFCRHYGEGLHMAAEPSCVVKERFTSTTLDRPELNALLPRMVALRCRNLVIDRVVDRLTSQGALAAAILLGQFTQNGILLHIASLGLVIRDEYAIQTFLQMSTAAKQSNDARIRARVQALRYNAEHHGRYVRGTRPPYGFQFETLATDARGRPTATRLVADRREIAGHRPWDVRQRILLDTIAGASNWAIAKKLTEEHVPTSRQLAGHSHANPYWSPTTIHDLVVSPLNVGVVTSFRQVTAVAPPDAHHPVAWKRMVRLPQAQHIALPSTTVAADAVLLSEVEAAALAARLAHARRRTPMNAGHGRLALLRDGVFAVCATPRPDDPTQPCGATLRVKSDGRDGSMQYVCRIHESQPARCGACRCRWRSSTSLFWAWCATIFWCPAPSTGSPPPRPSATVPATVPAVGWPRHSGCAWT